MKKVISYITKFLIKGNKAAELSCLVGYVSDPREFHRYSLVILPSTFFNEQVYGTPASMPSLPLQEIEGVPLLFGTSKIEWHNTTLVVHADIIASAYFLLSRYEEIRHRDLRDEHGRFPGKESLPYKAGFLDRPIVDEYGKLLRNWLRQTGVHIPEREPCIRKIWLTHDVDAPFFCRSFRNLIRETIKGNRTAKAWGIFNGPLEEDPFYTFPWILEQDMSVQEALGKKRCASLFFLKSGGKSKYDKPYYSLQSTDGSTLLTLLKSKGGIVGLHSSYDAGLNPSLINNERESLEKVTKQSIRHNRHHYLASREPEDMTWLEGAKITDDFTMGYSDVAGFRLGTSHPVRWINPVNRRLSSITLHPLTMMDVSLSHEKYMNMDYDEAFAHALKLINQVEKAGGELILLWHNDILTTAIERKGYAKWHKDFYAALMAELKKR